MSHDVAAVTIPLPDIDAAATGLPNDLDVRWAAWQERGRLHDLRVHRRFKIAIPTAGIVAAVAYLLFFR